MSDLDYQKLGLRSGASQVEIKAAFRRLALEHHPDRHGGSPAAAVRFREIVSAYKALLQTVPIAEADEFLVPAVPRMRRTAAPSQLLDLGILGIFLGLATAAVSAVLWNASASRTKRTRRAATAH